MEANITIKLTRKKMLELIKDYLDSEYPNDWRIHVLDVMGIVDITLETNPNDALNSWVTLDEAIKDSK